MADGVFIMCSEDMEGECLHSLWQECVISSLMKCPWLEERYFVNLTSIFAKCFFTLIRIYSCLNDSQYLTSYINI